MKKPKLKHFEGRDGGWYVGLVAANGRKLMTSEGYESEGNAIRAKDAIKRAMDKL